MSNVSQTGRNGTQTRALEHWPADSTPSRQREHLGSLGDSVSLGAPRGEACPGALGGNVSGPWSPAAVPGEEPTSSPAPPANPRLLADPLLRAGPACPDLPETPQPREGPHLPTAGTWPRAQSTAGARRPAGPSGPRWLMGTGSGGAPDPHSWLSVSKSVPKSETRQLPAFPFQSST